MTRIIHRFADISDEYDAAFVDLWGCMHNGVTSYQAACDAMVAYRARGGKVVLVTNAPRPFGSVEKQIRKLGIPDNAWDSIATSGDSARAAMFTGAVGANVWFIGEDHDQSFFSPLGLIDNPIEMKQVPLEQAEGIVCCGPFDPKADPSVYRPQFLAARERGLKLLCANPDIVVDRGESREWCAGALAALYEEMGGTSLYFGKPHPPIYDLARRRLAAVDSSIADSRIICIGDGINTDILGAMQEDLDSVFITGGLALEETATAEHPVQEHLDTYLQTHQSSPPFAMGYLR